VKVSVPVYGQWRAEGGGERVDGPGHPSRGDPKSEVTKIKMLN